MLIWQIYECNFDQVQWESPSCTILSIASICCIQILFTKAKSLIYWKGYKYNVYVFFGVIGIPPKTAVVQSWDMFFENIEEDRTVNNDVENVH